MPVDLKKFGKEIAARAKDQNPTGFAFYIIDQVGGGIPRFGKYGYAIKSFDFIATQEDPDYQGSAVEHHWERRQELMSVSKTITAAAVMKLVFAADPLDPDEPMLEDGLESEIADFLPESWDKSKIGGITIKKLLRHEGGMWEYKGKDKTFPPDQKGHGETPSMYLNMQRSVQRGPENVTPVYQNLNYGLFRVIIPYILLNRVPRSFWKTCARRSAAISLTGCWARSTSAS